MTMKYELFNQANSLDEFKALVLMNNNRSRFSYQTALQEFIDDIRYAMKYEEYSFTEAVSYLLATDSIYCEKDMLIHRLHRAIELYYGERICEEFPEYYVDEDELESVAA